ncbi:MAG TPA: methyltransferase domain-containing protein [Candidatus Sulfomarinibacteraceae bacterium]|nr:methyltransferase domain-containing protein [Candidatus Sulfomarinibacteraceae bacterium]
MEFTNTYQDTRRAAAYDELGLGNTYDLVFRNLPAILAAHVHGTSAVDFGCGTGRSSRFLKSLGFTTVGIDISAEMVAIARERDPGGDYGVIDDGDFSSLPQNAFDLVLSAFTFDNVPRHERKVRLLCGLGGLLRPTGRLVNVVSTPDIYTHEWVTFSTRDYPENRTARCGDVVRIVTTDYSDARPVDDILWPDDAYRAVYAEAGLEVERVERPLAIGDEGVSWVSETEVAPWAIYLLRPADRT